MCIPIRKINDGDKSTRIVHLRSRSPSRKKRDVFNERHKGVHKPHLQCPNYWLQQGPVVFQIFIVHKDTVSLPLFHILLGQAFDGRDDPWNFGRGELQYAARPLHQGLKRLHKVVHNEHGDCTCTQCVDEPWWAGLPAHRHEHECRVEKIGLIKFLIDKLLLVTLRSVLGMILEKFQIIYLGWRQGITAYPDQLSPQKKHAKHTISFIHNQELLVIVRPTSMVVGKQCS